MDIATIRTIAVIIIVISLILFVASLKLAVGTRPTSLYPVSPDEVIRSVYIIMYSSLLYISVKESLFRLKLFWNKTPVQLYGCRRFVLYQLVGLRHFQHGWRNLCHQANKMQFTVISKVYFLQSFLYKTRFNINYE